MGEITYETENTSVLSPEILFHALALDAEKLIPKIAPLVLTSTDIINGKGGPQSTITFGQGKIQC